MIENRKSLLLAKSPRLGIKKMSLYSQILGKSKCNDILINFKAPDISPENFLGGPNIKETYKKCRIIIPKFRTIRRKFSIFSATTDIWVASDLTTNR